MNIAHDLRSAAQWADAEAAVASEPALRRSHGALQAAAQRVGQAWSGSWLPGFTHLYDRDLCTLPSAMRLYPDAAVAHPLPELLNRCRVWTPQQIRTAIRDLAGNADASVLGYASAGAVARLDEVRVCFSALLARLGCPDGCDDELATVADVARHIQALQTLAVIDSYRPACAGHGPASVARVEDVPPHLVELAALEALMSPFEALGRFAHLMRFLAQRLLTAGHWQTALAPRPARAVVGARPCPLDASAAAG